MCANHDTTTKAICNNCDNEVDNLCATTSGEEFCEDCINNEGYYMCCDCGEYSQDGSDVNGDYYCEDCIGNNHTWCEHCGEYHHDDDFESVNQGHRGGTGQVCESERNRNSDIFCCNDCDTLYDNNYVGRYWVDDDLICENCIDNYSYCEECGEYYSGDYCCEDARLMIGNPSLYFYGDNKGGIEPYFGVENELDNGDRGGMTKLDQFSTHYGHKSDGSLSSQGVETVTNPMTLDYHQTQMDWTALLNMMKNAGYEADEKCGLHIHVNKTALTTEQWVWVEEFVLKHKGKIQKLAGREGNSYCAYDGAATNKSMYFVDKKSGRDYYYTGKNNIKKTKALIKNKVSHDRYKALNFNNKNTVEMRIFRATVQPWKVLAHIELYHALIMTARKNLDVLNWSALMITVKANKDRYANLIKRIDEKEIY